MQRRNRKKIIIGVGAGILVLAAGLYLDYRVNLEPAANSGKAEDFEIKSGQSAPMVATNLKAAGLIKSRNAFLTYINFHGLRSRLKAGTYSLIPTTSAAVIADVITNGTSLVDRLVVPEGYQLSQIEGLAVARGINKADFEAALAAPHSQSFLADKPATVSLEGYLFPDSYEVNSSTTAAELVNEMLDDFGQRVGSEYTQAFAAEGLSLHQGLTLASIIEKEVSTPSDRAMVAQVFLKRYKLGMPLGSDVTAQYASDLLGVPFDVNVNSPYNTRKFPGLPPGPICSPGLSALDAAAHPASTDYLYFVAGNDGKTHFAQTYAEHQQNVDKYLK